MSNNVIKNHFFKKEFVLDILGYVFFISFIVFGLLIVNLFATKEPFSSIENFFYYLSLTLTILSGILGSILMNKK